MEKSNVRRLCFVANACHVCKDRKTPYACTVCQMVFYCSAEHRRKDWYSHSRLCWAFNKICLEENVEHLLESWNGLDFTGFKHDVARKCVRLLGRNLQPWELEIIYHPRICHVCGESDWEKLKSCEGCGFVYTCGMKHFRDDHDKWCKTLEIYAELATCDLLLKDSDWKFAENKLILKINNRMNMSKVIDENWVKKDKFSDFPAIQMEVKIALLSDLLTYPLTVLNCLRQINAGRKKNLTILFVGAETQAEVEPKEKWEKYLLHQLPETKILNLVFMGPELKSKNNCQENSENFFRCQTKKLAFKFITGKFYHECASRIAVNVDLVCAFNSGMYRDHGFAEKDSWGKTITELFNRQRAPVVITEYTAHELNKDLQKLHFACGKLNCLVPQRKNPFASLKPGLNLISEEDAPVIFKNYFYVIVKPKMTEKDSVGLKIQLDRDEEGLA